MQDKVVATSFWGNKYGDNPKYILEVLHKNMPNVKIVWLATPNASYTVPEYITLKDCYGHGLVNQCRRFYEYSTSKVWLDSHHPDTDLKKRSGQLFIETWHGGLGIKHIEADVPKFNNTYQIKRFKHTAEIADLFISNSDFLTDIYRRAFGYKGKIWKCGFPKSDILLSDHSEYKSLIRERFGLRNNVKILLYAPTFRAAMEDRGVFDISPYMIDMKRLKDTIEAAWEGEWTIFVRWHPIMAGAVNDIRKIYGNDIIDATKYPDMQELVMACDAFITDYSSGIFDAALCEIPCFTFATDFEDYKKDRGTYFQSMSELPFPYAQNDDELMKNIAEFDKTAYLEKWHKFKDKMGLYETGHAAEDIAYVISEFIKGHTKPLEEIESV